MSKLDRPLEHLRSGIARGISEGAVDRTGGKDGAGLIEGFAVVTRGEARTHGKWLDGVFLGQVAEAVNGITTGAKVRFTHPSLSGDGLGKFLGRAKNARLDGDVVRADLHLSKTAHKAPDGDLAEYVMDLAEKDPAAFGASIVFNYDNDAERDFRKEHAKKSPDPDNSENLPHARLKALHAVDAVDDPAANPNGLFHGHERIAEDADALMSYALGVTDEVPELAQLGIDPDRGAGFVRRFLENHGLEVVSKSEQEENAMPKKTVELEATVKPVVAEDVNEGAAPVAPVLTQLRTADLPDIDEERKKAVQGERERIAELRKHARDDVSPELLQQAIDEGWSVADAAPKFLEDVRKQRAEPVRVGHDRSKDINDVLSNAVVLGGNLRYSDKEIPEAARREADQFRSMGLKDMGRFLVGRTGKPVPHDADALFTAAISGTDLPQIFGTAMRRQLHKGYTEYPSVFPMISAPREVKDFRTVKDVKLAELGAMDELGDAGEFKHDYLAESYEEYAVRTYGKIISFSRKQWINDDLQALRDTPAKMGRAAARNVDDRGFALLVSASGVGPTMTEDSKALFATNHADGANYAIGAGTVLADAGLTAAKLLMAKIKYGANYVDVQPKFLLVPPDLKDTAERLLKSRELMLAYRGDTDAGPTYLPPFNPHENSLTLLVKNSLTGATNGTTAWYLIANPADCPSLVLVSLRGHKNPTIEKVDLPGTLGLGWRIYHDVYPGLVDYRGIVRMKGA